MHFASERTSHAGIFRPPYTIVSLYFHPLVSIDGSGWIFGIDRKIFEQNRRSNVYCIEFILIRVIGFLGTNL